MLARVLVYLLIALHRKVDRIMADLSALNAAVDQLVASQAAAADELAALASEVAQLQAGTVSQEQIDAVTQRVTDVANALATATTGAEAATAGPGQPPPAAPPAEEPPAAPAS